MGLTAAYVGAAAAAAGAYTAYESNQEQKSVNKENKARAQANALASEQATNKANQKQVDSAGLLSSNAEAAKGGQSGTLLTGPGGVNPSALTLGRTTLLGGA